MTAMVAVRPVADLTEESFPLYLRELMERRKLTGRQVAAYAGVSPNTVNLWLRGAYQPRPETLLRIANALGVGYEHLMRAAGHLPRISAGASGHERETDGGAAPDTGGDAGELPASVRDALREIEQFIDGYISERIPVQESLAHAGAGAIEGSFVFKPSKYLRRKLIAIKVTGHCMEPDIYPGDVLVVDPEGSPRNGSVVVLEVDGRVLVRRYDTASGLLVALDESEEPLRIDDGYTCLPVVAMQRMFEG